MTILRNVSLFLLASTVIFSGLNCIENPLPKKLEKEAPFFAKTETLIGSNISSIGAVLTCSNWKDLGLFRSTLRKTGVVIVAAGVLCIGNSLSNHVKWTK